MRWPATVLLCIGLTACGSSQFDDLDKFVKDSGQGLRGKVEPLPQVNPYEPFTYNAFELPDPFKPRKLSPIKGSGTGIQPDLNRPKEPLESYPLESLKMMGTLQRNKVNFALVRTPDNTLYRVKAGNYMGQNYGVITSISESDITLKEIVQDSGGDWTERQSSVQLQEEQEQKK
jgi:type IV pilus assembly protein PilP